MSALSWGEPSMVHLLWAVLAVVGILWLLERRASSLLDRFLSRRMQERIVSRVSSERRYSRIVLLGLTGVFLVLALMQFNVAARSCP